MGRREQGRGGGREWRKGDRGGAKNREGEDGREMRDL